MADSRGYRTTGSRWVWYEGVRSSQMNRCLVFAAILLPFLDASAARDEQDAGPPHSRDAAVTLAAVSRDKYMFSGGIGPSQLSPRGTLTVEPMARLTSSGKWESLPCSPAEPKRCREFEHEYLKKPHTFTVVSADGMGTTIHASPVSLSECYGYVGVGKYSGAQIIRSAIAASSIDLFGEVKPPQLVNSEQGVAIRKAVARAIPNKLDSVHRLGLFALTLENHDLIIIQRAFMDFGTTPSEPSPKLIFAIVKMDQGRLHVLHWKQNTEDEEERVLGSIHLKSGRDFLITTVNDPESQSFRVYGIHDGHLELVFSGGGSSC